jgi:cation diffusion facilitator family transporter
MVAAMTSTSATPTQAAPLTKSVTALSVAVALILVAVKLVVWLISGSVALMASMADSGLDLIASTTTFIAVRYAASPPDDQHRYGHGKVEAFASLVQAGLVFASAALIGEEAIPRLMHPRPVVQEDWALAVMGLSVVLTAALILAQTRLLRRTRSVAVSADRTHYAADLASNGVALAGIAAAAFFGLPALDAIAGLIIAGILLWGAIAVFREGSSQLLDHEAPESARARIVSLVLQDPAVLDVHQLRTRSSGPFMHIQLHADLDPDLPLSTAHKIVVAAEKRILTVFPDADIIIHADPRGQAEPHGGAFAETYEG